MVRFGEAFAEMLWQCLCVDFRLLMPIRTATSSTPKALVR